MVDPDRLCLLVVKPDGVAQSLTAAVVAFLRRHGFRLLAYRQLVLVPARRAELYRATRAAGQLDWELNAILYTLGPVHALLLDGPAEAGFDSAAHRLSAGLKGSFIPARAGAGTIRGDLGALNPVFNLVHTTDATSDLDREAGALFDRPIRALAGRAGIRPGPADPAGTAAGADAAGAGTGSSAGTRAGPFRLWSTVAATLRSWLVQRAGPGVAEPLGAIDWPADNRRPDAAALRGAAEAWDALLAAVRPHVEPAALRLLAGVRTGASSYSDFHPAGAAPAWPAYLTYTTIRYLDLCLGSSDAG